MAEYQITDFAYGGKYHKFVWDKQYNPNATVENCMANCTTAAIAFSYIHRLPYPVSAIKSAANWDKVLINGWEAKPLGSVQLKVGDILQWKQHCHVATIIRFDNGNPILGCSWYTGEHGQSMLDGKPDPRDRFHSLQEVSDFMIANYPFRFYHEVTLAQEASMNGGMPENVLVAPQKIEPVSEDKSRNQIYVHTDTQNIRDNMNNIVGVAEHGYYNVLGSVFNNGYEWYEVEPNCYIAGVQGRVDYIPAQTDYDILLEENRQLKEDMKRIAEIASRWL